MKLMRTMKALIQAAEDVLSDLQELPSAFLDKDPAARSRWEVALLYPGFNALLSHRVSHALWKGECYSAARAITEISRWSTGIEIHPGAKLGKRVVIDHGLGTVIGETSVVKDDCLIYHGVTLGGVHNTVQKRHPTILERCVIGAGAAVLGDISIGPDSKVGAGSVVLKSVAAGESVGGIPAEVVHKKPRTQTMKS